MKKVFFLLLILQSGINAHAATLNWSWTFSPSSMVFDGVSDTTVYITVKNDITSTVSMDMSTSYFNLSDGTFGEDGRLYDSENNLFAVASYLNNNTTILNPGEEVRLSYFFFYQMLALSKETIEVNPLFYVREFDLNTEWYLSPVHAQFSTNPLLLSYAVVPLPPAVTLFFSGLVLLVSCLKASKKNRSGNSCC